MSKSAYRGDASAEAEYQAWVKQQGDDYIGKGAKQKWWDNYSLGQDNNKSFNSYMNDENASFSVSGSGREQQGRLEGLNRAKMLTGFTAPEIGKEYQEAYGAIKKRANGSDTGSELLRANKAGAVADARNQMQQQGVKGGSAANAVSQIERQKSYDVNNMQQENQRKAEMDYMNATKANANFTQQSEMNYGAMALGKDIKSSPTSNGGFGTVICTELHRQGYLSDKIMAKDTAHGIWMKANRPEIYYGYLKLASPLVKLMKTSPLLTAVVAKIAVPWAKDMAGDENTLGYLVGLFGEPLCYLVGKLTKSGEQYA